MNCEAMDNKTSLKARCNCFVKKKTHDGTQKKNERASQRFIIVIVFHYCDFPEAESMTLFTFSAADFNAASILSSCFLKVGWMIML